jgi:hypothetical protein
MIPIAELSIYVLAPVDMLRLEQMGPGEGTALPKPHSFISRSHEPLDAALVWAMYPWRIVVIIAAEHQARDLLRVLR